MKLASILILILFFNNIYSQELAKRFSEYLPSNILESHIKLIEVSEKIESVALIHPDLIYYLLKSLESSNTNSQSELWYTKHEIYYQNKKQKWAWNIIRSIENLNSDKMIINKARLLFPIDSIYINSTTLNSELINKNELDYIVLKYLDGRFTDLYDTKINYSVIREEIEKERRESINTIIRNSATLKHIDLIKKNWYFFSEKDDITLDPKIIVDILDKFIVANDNNINRFGLTIGFTRYSNFFDTDYEHTFNHTLLKLKYPIKLDAQSLHFSFIYLHPFQSVSKEFLSYIRSELQFHYLFMSNSKGSNISELNYTSSGVKYREELSYNIQVRPKASYSLNFKITSPIYLYNKSIAIEVGMITGFTRYQYNIKYEYEYLKYATYWVEVLNFWNTITTSEDTDKIKTHYKDSSFFFIPILQLHYALTPNYNIQVLGSHHLFALNLIYFY